MAVTEQTRSSCYYWITQPHVLHDIYSYLCYTHGGDGGRYHTYMQCSPRAKLEAWWEGVLGWNLWPVHQSYSHFHIKENSIRKAWWADMPYVCRGEHSRILMCTCTCITAGNSTFDHFYGSNISQTQTIQYTPIRGSECQLSPKDISMLYLDLPPPTWSNTNNSVNDPTNNTVKVRTCMHMYSVHN